MMRLLNNLSIMCGLFIVSCAEEPNWADTKYCYADSYQELKLVIKEKKDTLFLYYLNILDDGNFINGYSNLDDDFAGYIYPKNITNNAVKIRIKNYRFPEVSYLLNLKFYEHKVLWQIQDSLVSYLPDKAILTLCNTQ